jgi:hypothetical protein
MAYSNHLHEIVGKPIEPHQALLGSETRIIYEHISPAARGAIAFALDEHIDRRTVIPMVEELDRQQLLRLPYAATWIEYQHQSWRFGALMTMLPAGTVSEASREAIAGEIWVIRGSPFIRKATRAGAFVFCGGRMTTWTPRAWAGPDASMHDLQDRTAWTCIAFLGALACNNVQPVEHNPTFTQRRTARKHKDRAIFSTWTLEIKPAGPRRDQGGTHASPRVHLRRGHVRQYKPGKYTWVQPAVVGEPKLGMIHKDYRLDGRTLNQAQRP